MSEPVSIPGYLHGHMAICVFCAHCPHFFDVSWDFDPSRLAVDALRWGWRRTDDGWTCGECTRAEGKYHGVPGKKPAADRAD